MSSATTSSTTTATGTTRPPVVDPALLSISLDALNAQAALQTRVDRKYVIGPDLVSSMTSALADTTRVLEIDGGRSFGYRSVYFDTPMLEAYRAAAHRRRRRWKVRIRFYLTTGLCMLEVKTKSGRGDTVKSRMPYRLSASSYLTSDACRFIEQATDGSCDTSRLMPTLSTSYRRTTLVDVVAGSRLTIDSALRCTDWDRRRASIGDLLVVETKSARRPSPADRWLWNRGVRPTKISKFCTGLAALHPDLPDNKWHRTLARDWQVEQ